MRDLHTAAGDVPSARRYGAKIDAFGSGFIIASLIRVPGIFALQTSSKVKANRLAVGPLAFVASLIFPSASTRARESADVVANSIDRFAYRQALNGNPVTAAGGGVNCLIAFASANNSPGSNTSRILSAPSVAAGSPYVTLAVTSWLRASCAGGGCRIAPLPAADLPAALRQSASTQFSVQRKTSR